MQRKDQGSIANKTNFSLSHAVQLWSDSTEQPSRLALCYGETSHSCPASHFRHSHKHSLGWWLDLGKGWKSVYILCLQILIIILFFEKQKKIKLSLLFLLTVLTCVHAAEKYKLIKYFPESKSRFFCFCLQYGKEKWDVCLVMRCEYYVNGRRKIKWKSEATWSQFWTCFT